eukprot:6179640-Pleurochrysis_carterae.AAC.2
MVQLETMLLTTTAEAGETADGWVRNDGYCVSERAWHDFHLEHVPMLTFANATTISFFDFCMQWFDQKFLIDMAAEMQQAGREKGRRWAAWKAGERRAYFNASITFGPMHSLDAVLELAENGHKGVRWFKHMHVTFALPTRDGVAEVGAGAADASDPVYPCRLRRMWDDCCAVFVKKGSSSLMSPFVSVRAANEWRARSSSASRRSPASSTRVWR